MATWKVDVYGRALTHTDFGGRTIHYSYDAAARQLIGQRADAHVSLASYANGETIEFSTPAL